MEDRPPILDRAKDVKEHVESDLKQGNPMMWHRVIMSACFAVVGLVVIGGIVLDFVLDRQTESLRHMPVIGIRENAVLSQGDYYIYQAYFDADDRTHFLVSRKEGGVVVSVFPPEDTPVPPNILEMLHFDPATYEIAVDESGEWTFVETHVLKEWQEKQQQQTGNSKQ